MLGSFGERHGRHGISINRLRTADLGKASDDAYNGGSIRKVFLYSYNLSLAYNVAVFARICVYRAVVYGRLHLRFSCYWFRTWSVNGRHTAASWAYVTLRQNFLVGSG